MQGGKTVFECRQCGHCCSGKGGIVLSPDDLDRLAGFLQMQPEAVVRDFAEVSNGKLRLRMSESGWCVFFIPGAGCSVHEGKPDICRAWPFFRGNLEDAVSLAMAREFCPGIAKEVSHADFVEAGLAYLRENELLATDSSTSANSLVLEKAFFKAGSH